MPNLATKKLVISYKLQRKRTNSYAIDSISIFDRRRVYVQSYNWVCVCDSEPDMRQLLRIFSFCLLLLLLWAPAADCKSKKKSQPAMDPQTEQLIRTLFAQPELMDLDYLTPKLGRPENEQSQTAKLERKYFWYDPVSHTPLYQLEQTLTPPSKRVFAPSALTSASGRVTESIFTVFLDQQNIKDQDIKNLFGSEEKTYFDSNGTPCKMYNTAPNTMLLFTEPQGMFRVTQARITYQGPPLTPVGQIEREESKAANVKLASQELERHDWHAAELHLRQHLAQYPQDAAVHFELAQTLREEGEINNAINEYRTALKYAGGNDELRDQCLAGLQELKVPTP
jgi:hypothetical protein